MSRGLGKTQTQILAILRVHAASSPRGGLDTILRRVTAVPPFKAEWWISLAAGHIEDRAATWAFRVASRLWLKAMIGVSATVSRRDRPLTAKTGVRVP